jgi:hypothetical protein
MALQNLRPGSKELFKMLSISHAFEISSRDFAYGILGYQSMFSNLFNWCWFVTFEKFKKISEHF